MNNYMCYRLQDHEHAQAYVRELTDGSLVLVSYVTEVIRLDPAKNTVECTGTYSRTTIKHIGWFLREYFPSLNYYDMKAIAGTGEHNINEILQGRKVA